jgi:hypothetical protein
LVEQWTENPRVVGSIPTLATNPLEIFMANVEKLQEWNKQAIVDGLVDVKLFPRVPGDPEPDLERAAGELLALLTEPGEDITHLDL